MLLRSIHQSAPGVSRQALTEPHRYTLSYTLDQPRRTPVLLLRLFKLTINVEVLDSQALPRFPVRILSMMSGRTTPGYMRAPCES